MANKTLRDVVDRFVDELSQLIEELTHERLRDALNALGRGNKGKSPRVASASRGGRIKRTSGDLAAIQGKVLARITSNPGLRIEQINKLLGTTTKDLALPVRQLIKAKKIRSEGNKRATVYYAAGAKRKGKKTKS